MPFMTSEQPDFKALDLINYLPGPNRPINPKVVMFHDENRYGGFTSTTHAHLVAKHLGFKEYEVKEEAAR